MTSRMLGAPVAMLLPFPSDRMLVWVVPNDHRMNPLAALRSCGPHERSALLTCRHRSETIPWSLCMPFDLKQVLDERRGENFSLHSKYINPQLPRFWPDRIRPVLRERRRLLPHRRQGGPLPGPPVGLRRLRSRAKPSNNRSCAHDALDADLPNLVQMDCSLLSGVLASSWSPDHTPGSSGCSSPIRGRRRWRAPSSSPGPPPSARASSIATTPSTASRPGRSALNGGREFRTGFGPLLPGAT